LQRLFDIFFSSFALIVLSPVLLPIVFVLRVTGEGKVFFLQERIGDGRRSFQLYKFATMLENSPNMGTGTVTLTDDPRILPFGRILRKTKINELPQLINIFLGDMSVIGPRPQTQRCFDAFPEQSQQAIMQVRPGLSGVGSIVFRNEDELMDGQGDPDHFYDKVIMPYKGRLEEWYVQNQSLGWYFVLIATTMWIVLCPQSNIVRGVFSSKLPSPPDELEGKLPI
jgi:lipopolysaccharide/colanic/teichoic acid biosynthesis glycosyltransferase